MKSGILLVDTSEHACKVAVFNASEGVVAQAIEPQGRQHADILLPLADQVLSESGVSPESCDAIAILNGPGAFTGLRIGIAMVQGLSYGWGLPCIPVNTLQAWAWSGFARADRVLCVMDARMGEVYAGCYEKGEAEPILAPSCLDPHGLDLAALSHEKSLGIVGSGISAYEPLFNEAGANFDITLYTDPMSLESYGRLATHLFEQNKAVPPEALDALYLRPAVKQS